MKSHLAAALLMLSPAVLATTSAQRGPEEIPWGKALWRGTVRFEIKPMPATGNGRPAGLDEEERGSYDVTWSEEVIGRPPYISGIKLKLVTLVYQDAWTVSAAADGHCAGFSLSKQGTIAETPTPSMGNLTLPLPADRRFWHAGRYQLHIMSPGAIPATAIPKTCSTGAAPYAAKDAHALPWFSLGDVDSHHCSVPSPKNVPDGEHFEASPPYTTLAGEMTCEASPPLTLRWRFDRGVPPPSPEPSTMFHPEDHRVF